MILLTEEEMGILEIDRELTGYFVEDLMTVSEAQLKKVGKWIKKQEGYIDSGDNEYYLIPVEALKEAGLE